MAVKRERTRQRSQPQRVAPIPTGWQPLDSTCLSAYRYDAAERVLWLRFKDSGEEYGYPGVGANAVRGLQAAASKGTWFNANLQGRSFIR